jgi:hypothetical protein
MAGFRFPVVCFFLIGSCSIAGAQPASIDPLAERVHALERLVKRLQAERSVGTWETYGCVPDDPTFDNGPLLSRILAEQGRSIGVAPIGAARDYYVSSTIVWPKRHGGALLGAGGYTGMLRGRNPGVTRIIWNGPPGVPMIDYKAAGGRISQVVIQGALAPTAKNAAIGILVESDKGPPTGKLVTDQVTLANLDVGIKCVDYPTPLFAAHLTHYALQFHQVRLPYWVDNRQSVCHTFFKVDFRNGFQQALRFDAGGALNIYGCYVGNCDGSTLLYLGKTDSGSGAYEIHGLQADGNAKRLRLVDHGKFKCRVRIGGSISITAIRQGLADPIVLERDGPSEQADVQIDCTNGIRWPKGKDN